MAEEQRELAYVARVQAQLLRRHQLLSLGLVLSDELAACSLDVAVSFTATEAALGCLATATPRDLPLSAYKDMATEQAARALRATLRPAAVLALRANRRMVTASLPRATRQAQRKPRSA